MADIFCAASDCYFKAGKDVSVDWVSGTVHSVAAATATSALINEIEASMNAELKKNLLTAYAAASDETKLLLQQACSARVAMIMIAYDMASYPSISMAQTLINVNSDIYNSAMRELKDKDVRNFLFTT